VSERQRFVQERTSKLLNSCNWSQFCWNYHSGYVVLNETTVIWDQFLVPSTISLINTCKKLKIHGVTLPVRFFRLFTWLTICFGKLAILSMDYGQKHETNSANLVRDILVIGCISLLSFYKSIVFTRWKAMVKRVVLFEDTAWVPVTISNEMKPQLRLASILFDLTISPIKRYRKAFWFWMTIEKPFHSNYCPSNRQLYGWEVKWPLNGVRKIETKWADVEVSEVVNLPHPDFNSSKVPFNNGVRSCSNLKWQSLWVHWIV
jgi:hypothetical protein